MRNEVIRDAIFVLTLWIGTRLIIAIAVFVVAPGGLERLAQFDGGWYASIVQDGYSYAGDGEAHNVAFFPGYPAFVWLVTRLGLSVTVASLLVNNIAFAAALFVLFDWVRRRCDVGAARWTVATACCCPMSLYGSTAYSEGLFLLLTALALRDFDRMRSGAAAIWAALASLTRLPALALVPAFALTTMLERRPRIAWLAVVAPLAGASAFAVYCGTRFGDPLAFVHTQIAWRPHLGFDESAWQNLFGAGIAGKPILHLASLAGVPALWFGRRHVHPLLATAVALAVVEAERWAWNGSEYVMLLTIIASGAALFFRRQLGMPATAYALAAVGLIALSGQPVSVDRFAYSIAPIIVALALIWQRIPALGVAVLAVMTIDLYAFALNFARGIFVS